MAVTSGFFNAEYDGNVPDRAYNAEQFGELFDGVMNDGVFGSVGDALEVSAGSGMSVRVAPGRAWFNHVWVKNSNVLTLEISSSSAALDRYDAIILDINKDISVRAGDIKVVTGVAASNPAKPTMIHTASRNQYPLAYILVRAGSTSIAASDIEDARGTTECPFASGILSGISIIGQPAVSSLTRSSVFLLEGPSGLNKIASYDLLPALANVLSPKNHRRLYRGKNLGSTFTAAQKANIADGSFIDLFVGDYWEIDGVKYRIVDIDYWYGVGDTKCMTHHLVIMPDTTLADVQMVSTASTSGAYIHSIPVSSTLSTIRSTYLVPAFGSDHILSHRGLFEDSASNGMATNTEWYDSRAELPSEIQILGTHNMSSMSANGVLSNHKTVDRVQFALFDIDPSAIIANHTYWLRDIVSASEFACIYDDGASGRATANSTYSIRPVFGITGGAQT